jgi:hypothetical protein
MKIVDDSLPDDAQERIATLETKCREMETQIRTLLADLLDLKSVSMKMTRDAAHYQSQIPAQDSNPEEMSSPAETEPAPAGTPGGNTTVIRPKSASRPEVPVAEPAPAMVRIMQSDGTFKMEVRRGDSSLRDSTGGWKDNQKSTLLKRKTTR